MEHHIRLLAKELQLTSKQVAATTRLLEAGATIPFIARYRKEATDSLDETAVTAIRERLAQLAQLDKRREAIVRSLQDRGQLTEDLKEKLLAADSLSGLEDIYLPYRPKRRTRAMAAREKGLEGLAEALWRQEPDMVPAEEAELYLAPDKGVETVSDALCGSRDILAEWINENPEARERFRRLYAEKGILRSRVVPGKETEGAKFRDYYDWQEPLRTAPSHRVLAMRRGEKEEVLDLKVEVPEEESLQLLKVLFVRGESPASQEVETSAADAYRRLLSPAMETEWRLETKRRADADAIEVFGENLRELLLASPLGEKRTMAVDPGIRTGCKVASLDRQGNLLDTDTLYPFGTKDRRRQAADRFRELAECHGAEAIAVGNGTGGRETQAFLRRLEFSKDIPVVLVDESGASIYSASKVARAEFPDLDISYRGAVSIGRRLMDPLAELVKLDPKSIGVGQYQHDVNPQALRRRLGDVVVSCVNAVGVEVNTASEQLLSYVSGLGPQLARNIVNYRSAKGPFQSREELKRVPRLGPKAFEQAAGFLRVTGAANPLDGSAVHPESYPIVESMAADAGCRVSDLIRDRSLREKIDPNRYVTDRVGLPTLNDLLAELEKPGRDPRDPFENVEFAEGIKELEDLESGMRLSGIVTNVTAFGAFVDVGVHQDGLVHISELADHYVRRPNEVVKVRQRVSVTVLDVDLERKRIALSMKKVPGSRRSGGSRNGGGKKGPPKGSASAFDNPLIEKLKRRPYRAQKSGQRKR